MVRAFDSLNSEVVGDINLDLEIDLFVFIVPF